MKKILYIIPIVVFAMVGLTQDAKAQTGQTGNASNAITQGATNAVIGAALNTTTTGSDNTVGGGTTVGATVAPTAPTPPPPPSPPASQNVPGAISAGDVPNASFAPAPDSGATVVVSPGSPVTLSFGGFQPGEMTVASAPDAVTLA